MPVSQTATITQPCLSVAAPYCGRQCQAWPRVPAQAPQTKSAVTMGNELQYSLDLLWLIIAAGLVMFMQAGFTMLESGLVRAKNSYNVAIKNISDFIIAVLAFWFVGFALMFGLHGNHFLSWSGFAGADLSNPKDIAFFVFQATFVGTAATIVAGAVAERAKFVSYIVISLIISLLIYPIFGHWAWASSFSEQNQGWLETMGFMDFAGSTVVHSLGGWLALAGAMVLGPRIGRFNDKGQVQAIPGHNLLLSTLGVFILTFGWFGFNGGSTLSANQQIPGIMLNTLLAASAGGCFTLGLSYIHYKRIISVEKTLNGLLAGLVSITASCAYVSPNSAMIIGLVGGLVVYLADEFFLRVLKVDDPVGAAAVHGAGGAWGTLALAFFTPVEQLAAGSLVAQAGVQLVGVVVCFVWAFGLLKAIHLVHA